MSVNPLLQRLGVTLPIIQAPMAGGPTTPALAAAVSNAGGLGFLAAAYLTPEEVRKQIIETRRLTRRPFGVNTFAGGETRGAADPAPMLAALLRWATDYDVELPDLRTNHSASADFAGLQEVAELVLEFEVPVFSVTFGVPDAQMVATLRERGVFVFATATTAKEARMLQAAGVDAVVAQGAEAGAHRATFAAPFEDALIGTLALVPQVVDDVDVPVIASGGIMDGRGIVAAMALGAVAVQMGTAFLACDEAATPAAWRHRLLSSTAEETCVTRVFSGRPARAIRNQFLNELETEQVPVPPYPLQNALTRPIRRAAAARGDANGLSLWAGQGVGLIRPMPTTALMQLLAREISEIRDVIVSIA